MGSTWAQHAATGSSQQVPLFRFLCAVSSKVLLCFAALIVACSDHGCGTERHGGLRSIAVIQTGLLYRTDTNNSLSVLYKVSGTR